MYVYVYICLLICNKKQALKLVSAVLLRCGRLTSRPLHILYYMMLGKKKKTLIPPKGLCSMGVYLCASG